MSQANLDVLELVLTGMKEKYYTFDVDGDGTITNDEFRQVLEEMVGEPCPEDDWKEFIAKVDYDQSKTVSFDEFLYALYLWFADEEDEEDDDRDEVDIAFGLLKNKFQEADKDSDDIVSYSEYQGLTKSLLGTESSEEELKKVYSAIGNEFKSSISFKQYLYSCYVLVTKDFPK